MYCCFEFKLHISWESLSNARWFYGKKTQNWEGKLEINILLKIGWVETKYGVRKVITVICVIYVQKALQIRTLIK